MIASIFFLLSLFGFINASILKNFKLILNNEKPPFGMLKTINNSKENTRIVNRRTDFG
jgi:hypothetical protein